MKKYSISNKIYIKWNSNALKGKCLKFVIRDTLNKKSNLLLKFI